MIDTDSLREFARPFDALKDHLLAAAEGHHVVYIPNPGNRGDALIRYGTKLLLDDIGLLCEEVNISGRWGRAHLVPIMLRRDRPILFLYGGGGAWSNAYPGAYNAVEFLSRFNKKVFVLPTTFELPRGKTRATLYRRDEMQSRERVPDSQFCHDMAFYALLNADRLGFSKMAIEQEVGIHFRTDREGRFPSATLPEQNVDLSSTNDHMSLADEFLRTLAKRRVILTDRLHVAIGGLIAGRQVQLATGNYFKIKAIFETSINPNFGDRVTLLPDDLTPAQIVEACQIC